MKCSRTVCQAEGYFPHVDIVGNLYCHSCALRINQACQAVLVTTSFHEVTRVLRARLAAPLPAGDPVRVREARLHDLTLLAQRLLVHVITHFVPSDAEALVYDLAQEIP